MSVAVTVTYVGPQSPTTFPHPITLHTWPFSDPEFLVLAREHGDGGEWEEIKADDGCMGFRLVDNPPIRTNAGTHKSFISLAPGESWSVSHEVHRGSRVFTHVPRDAQLGEGFRYTFTAGSSLDWWAWGAKEEHVKTEVWLPNYVHGPVLNEEGHPRKRSEDDPSEVVLEQAVSAVFVFTDLPNA